MKILGITGPTGAGKTTALKELEKMGAQMIDADAVYHQMLNENAALRNELELRFGPLTDESGEFDRKKLGRIVFQDSKALEDLNKIAHRHIVEQIRGMLMQAQQNGLALAAVDAIALFESGLAQLCDETIAVLAPAEIRIKRIMVREGISEEYARMRVEAQNKDEFFTSRCTHILFNDCQTPEEFGQKANHLFTILMQ